MDDYIRQMQEYLNKNSSRNEGNENNIEKEENNSYHKEEQKINMDKDKLYECFQQIMNNSNNNNEEYDNIDNNIKIENKKIQNFDDMPLPALKNKKNNFDEKKEIKNNIDEMPIKGNNNVNFNELLEKELSKEQNEGNYNNNIPTKPKFKYVPKKKVDLVSAPGNTKKFKYYSDNFKPRNRGHSVNITKKINNIRNNDIMEKNDEEMENNSDDFNKYNSKNNSQNKKKRVAPVMPDNFKNSKFNRGRGYTGPQKEGNLENNNINNNNNNKLNINENNNIKSLWGEFQNNYEQGKDEDENDLEDFHNNEDDDDEIKMNSNVGNNDIFDKSNNFNKNDNNNNYNDFNYNFNNDDVDKEETPVQQQEPIKEDLDKNYKEKEEFGVINEEYIKNLMNYDDMM